MRYTFPCLAEPLLWLRRLCAPLLRHTRTGASLGVDSHSRDSAFATAVALRPLTRFTAERSGRSQPSMWVSGVAPRIFPPRNPWGHAGAPLLWHSAQMGPPGSLAAMSHPRGHAQCTHGHGHRRQMQVVLAASRRASLRPVPGLLWAGDPTCGACTGTHVSPEGGRGGHGVDPLVWPLSSWGRPPARSAPPSLCTVES